MNVAFNEAAQHFDDHDKNSGEFVYLRTRRRSTTRDDTQPCTPHW